MAIATYGGDELLTVREVRKWLGESRFERVCAGGACLPVIGPNGKRAYFKSFIERGLERDKERPASGDADTDEILARYQDDGNGHETDDDGDEDDAVLSPAVEREMRRLLVALRRRVEEGENQCHS
jgi:hypothetical protein